MKVVIFDLDDTLINGRPRVPRQTRHMLKRLLNLGCKIGIISYNPMIHYACAVTKLLQYTNYIFYGDCNRDVLFKTCFDAIANDCEEEITDVYYADDREDNINVVKNSFPYVTTFHCNNLYTLYKIKHVIEEK